MAVAAMLLPLGVGLLRDAGLSRGESNFGRALMIATAFGPLIGGIATPGRNSREPRGHRPAEAAGRRRVSFMRWMAYGVPASLLMVPLGVAAAAVAVSAGDRAAADQPRGDSQSGWPPSAPLSARSNGARLWIFLACDRRLGSQRPSLSAWTGGRIAPPVEAVALAGGLALFLPGIRVMTWKEAEREIDWGGIMLIVAGLSLGLVGVRERRRALARLGAARSDHERPRSFVKPFVIVLAVAALHLLFSSNTVTASIIVADPGGARQRSAARSLDDRRAGGVHLVAGVHPGQRGSDDDHSVFVGLLLDQGHGQGRPLDDDGGRCLRGAVRRRERMAAHVTSWIVLLGGLLLMASGTMMPPPIDASQPAASCGPVASGRFPNVVVAVSRIEPGAFSAPTGQGGRTGGAARDFSSLAAFCRVVTILRPVSGSEIGVEVWLPLDRWNGKLQAVGNRGWGGAINYGMLADVLSAGYAAVSTDTGHTGAGATFALGSPERVIDSGYRAVHEMTVFAKAVVEAHYGRAARFTYFNGCSLGGRQGLASAQRYPADYDGIVAGDPVHNLTQLYSARLAIARVAHRSRVSRIAPEKYQVIHDAVMASCDRLDRVADGVLEDPRRCGFDPGVLRCEGAEHGGCLTAEEVETARAMYAPIRHPRTGALLSRGLERGTELGWSGTCGCGGRWQLARAVSLRLAR